MLSLHGIRLSSWLRGWVNIIHVAVQTLGQTFPSLSPTGEGFLLRFERGASPCPEQGRSARTLAVVGVGVLRCPNEGSRHAPVAARHPHRTRTRAANRVLREFKVAFFFPARDCRGRATPARSLPREGGTWSKKLAKILRTGGLAPRSAPTGDASARGPRVGQKPLALRAGV